MSQSPQSDDGDWTVIDKDNDNERTFPTRSEAEDAAETVRELGSENVEIRAPHDNRDSTSDDNSQEAMEAEVVEVEDADTTPVDVDEGPSPADDAQPLPDRDLTDDPLTWVPGEFVDNIDGTQAINRKGFEVLAHFYDVDVEAELQVAPDETGHEYARVKAVATTADGRTCEAFGSAHVDRGDDKTLLLEMAGTRARKRALSIATGVGAVAVAELKSAAEDGGGGA